MSRDPGSSAPPSPARRLFALFRPERVDIGVLVLLSVINGVLLLATPLAVDAVVNNIAFGGREQVYLQALLILSVALFAFLILLAVMRAAQHYVMEVIQQRLFVRLTADLSYRLPHTKMTALEPLMGPELINRFFEIITVQKSSSMLLLEGVNLTLATIIGLIVLGFYHPFLLAFAFLLIVALGVIFLVLGRGAVKTSIDESYAKHAVAGWLEQIALFPELFKGDGAGEFACRRADMLTRDYVTTRKAHFRVLIRQISGLLALQAVASAALLTIGGALVLKGELTLGQLVASELIVGAIVSSVAKFGKHLESWYDAVAAADKLGYLVDLPIEREGGEAPVVTTGPAMVRAERIAFGLDPTRPLEDDLSFEFQAGVRVALAGAAEFGAGIILDLLYGLNLTSEGVLSIDGIDVRHWDLGQLRKQVALVRDADIFAGTIAENVRLGRDDIGLEKVRSALDCVGLSETLLHLPNGIDTDLRPGGRPLSSSQRTRLVLARAIIGAPRLLLIDKCLDGLDPQSTAELVGYLFDRKRPWTLVLVTRDPDLISRCDRALDLGEFHFSKALAPGVHR